MIYIGDQVFSRGTGNILFVCAFAAVLSKLTNQAICCCHAVASIRARPPNQVSSLKIEQYINLSDVNKNKSTQVFSKNYNNTRS
jgi:hypothetical protein